MKKLAICFLFLALSTLLMAVAPVFAEPAQKIPVIMVTSGGTNVPIETRETNGGIIHGEFIRSGNVMLTIDGQAPIVGTYSEFLRAELNTKTGENVIQNFDVLTFPGGSFEGVKQTRITYSSPGVIEQIEQHAVFQGSGIFEGQKLVLSMEAPPFPPVYTGSLLIH